MAAPRKAVGFSLGLGGKAQKKRQRTFNVQEKEEENKGVYVQSISAKKLRKLGSNKKKELVIPLQAQTSWKKEDEKVEAIAEAETEMNGISAPSRMESETKSSEKKKYGLTVRGSEKADVQSAKPERKPMLLMNMVPGMDKYDSENDKFRHDLGMRPEESTLDDYERVPVEEFGKALLRGMGWKPGGKIGVGVNAKHVEAKQFLRRGYRQGLGADDTIVALKNAKKEKRFIRPGEKRGIRMPQKVAQDAQGRRRHYQVIGEKLIKPVELGPQALVEFIDGPHKGLYGNVERMVIKTGGGACIVNLRIGGATVKAQNKNLKVLNPSILPKDHPAFRTSASSGRRPGKDDPKKKKKKVRPVTWVCPNIRVRVISKKLEGGKYYSQKGVVHDVLSRFVFSVVMDKDKKLIENVIEKNVETALPKAGGKAMVVLGKHKGKIGTVLERNSRLQKCVLQFDEDLQHYQCGFEKLAEYVSH